ncbi:sodium-dependent transporter [uncultured Brachyspira sp.]|uniref:sodium-dependent transporter n=1 Tax=uncultured Brachyspira sp. TaxID=221953 RepID=UPI0025FF093E|nr:sodium-dependent transporter [uncultured Brachyspira sp.]
MHNNREKLSSRLGFLLVSAGCAIGLGNVWRFPYTAGKYGGALFVFLYLIALIILGLPILIMEFSVGRAGKSDLAGSYRMLQKNGHKWHIIGYVQILGCVLLMMFYTTVAGWCLSYCYFTASGKLYGLNPQQTGEFFNSVLASPSTLVLWMTISIIIAAFVCIMGLENGVEKVTKVMMTLLLLILFVLIIRAVTLPNAKEGLKFYLLPNFNKMFSGGIKGFFSVAYAAIGQAFFTLSLGIGAMTIFGSYIDKSYSLTGESIMVVGLDTLIAILSGLVIFPTTFSFGINPGEGAGLAFITLPNIFNSMVLGRLWGALFFLFLSMAALTTIIAVFENIIAFIMSETKMSRKKTTIIAAVSIFILSLPTALGFNLLSFIKPLGGNSTIADGLDFLVSNNFLPLGGIIILIFCTRELGWGWDNFIKEADVGKGLKFPKWARFYVSYILPFIILAIFIIDYVNKFLI